MSTVGVFLQSHYCAVNKGLSSVLLVLYIQILPPINITHDAVPKEASGHVFQLSAQLRSMFTLLDRMNEPLGHVKFSPFGGVILLTMRTYFQNPSPPTLNHMSLSYIHNELVHQVLVGMKSPPMARNIFR